MSILLERINEYLDENTRELSMSITKELRKVFGRKLNVVSDKCYNESELDIKFKVDDHTFHMVHGSHPPIYDMKKANPYFYIKHNGVDITALMVKKYRYGDTSEKDLARSIRDYIVSLKS